MGVERGWKDITEARECWGVGGGGREGTEGCRGME